MFLSTETPQVFLTPIPYLDYEVFLGPIELYDWRGDSHFDIKFALALLPACDSLLLPTCAVTPLQSKHHTCALQGWGS
jgi:hypothetical protein